MKIAIISSGFYPVIDGVTVSLYQRVRVLSQLGHQVLILCPDYQPLAAIYPHWQDYQGKILPGIYVVSLPSEPFMGVDFERNLSRKANRYIQQELEKFQPDVVHVDEPDRIFLGTLTAPGVAYAKAHSIPCVGFYHTNFIDYIEDFLPLPSFCIVCLQWLSMLFIRPVFHAYNVILTASPTTQQRLQQLRVKNTVCDRYLGVDITAFKAQKPTPDFFRKTYAINNISSRIKLTFLGRLTPDKGWKFTLKALSKWANNPNSAPYLNQVTFIIAGEGDMQPEIETGLSALGLSAHFLGRIPPPAVPALLTNSDIHITTSEKETLGLTVLESLAAGTPVIAPKAGGVVTHIRTGINGLLYEPQNLDSFSQALTQLVADRTVRQAMGKQGQQDVEAYDWHQAVAKLIGTWASLKT
ncbi:MAG: glycosyltransferase [Phormidesmis sp.]